MRRAPGHRRREMLDLGLSAALSTAVHALLLIGLPTLLWLTDETPENLKAPPRVVHPEAAPRKVVEILLVPRDRLAALTDSPDPLPPSAPKPSRPELQQPRRVAQARLVEPRLEASRSEALPVEGRPPEATRLAPRQAPRLALASPEETLEPVVECRVRLVSREIARPRLGRPPWLQARTEQGTEPWEERTEALRPAAARAAPPAVRAAERTDHAAEPMDPLASLPFVAHVHGVDGLGEDQAALVRAALAGPPIPLEGDRRAYIDSVQARIDAVTPLVHATAWGCRHHRGHAELRFLIGPKGYALGYQLVSSSGSYCLDTHINEVLHLAEPFPPVQGWVPVHVTFERERS
jgi:hypothetical protein